MNKERRKWIQEIQTKLESVKKELSDVLEEEEEYFNSMPEGFSVRSARRRCTNGY